MADADWRDLERRWLGDPGDQEALGRLVAARERAGEPPSRRLIDARVEPGRELSTRHLWRVWAQLPEGEVIEVGSTPRWLGRPLRIPEHRQWWVEPLVAPDDGSMRGLADELRREGVTGLELPAGRVSDAGLAHLARVECLRTLYLKAGRHVSDQGVRHLTGLTGLERLRLWGCTALTDAAAEALAELVRLTSLELPGSEITDAGAAHLARLERLTELGLTLSQIGDAGLVHISNLRGLASLDLDACAQLTDEGIEALSRLSGLVKLNLLGCRRVTDRGLRALARLPGLSLLVVGRGVSDEAAAALRAALPACIVARAWDSSAWSSYPWDRPLVR